MHELGCEMARAAPSENARFAQGHSSARQRSSRTPPQMALITDGELATAPQYMRSRLDVAKVNMALNEIQKLLTNKYSLLNLSPTAARSLNDTERKKLAAFKALEADGGKQMFFFSEDDLKSLSIIKADATGKNLLAVLRHVGRLKEIKHSGLKCWRVS